jgi:hypothetical protein
VNFYDFEKSESTFKAFSSKPMNVTKVTLTPGQVLYIPPYHLSHVETSNNTFSDGEDAIVMGLDILSPSLQQLILLEAFAVQIPFKSLVDSFEERVIGAQVSE